MMMKGVVIYFVLLIIQIIVVLETKKCKRKNGDFEIKDSQVPLCIFFFTARKGVNVAQPDKKYIDLLTFSLGVD